MTFRNDETIICAECGRPFHWSYRQQRNFRDKRLDQPKHCPDCIEIRRDYFRSGESDHPRPVANPEDNPFLVKTKPEPVVEPVKPRPIRKRPFLWQNPVHKMTATLWLLGIIFVLLVLLIIATLL